MSQAKSYAYGVERADGSYRADLPDLPGCGTTADSPEQVERQLPEAVSLSLSYFHDRNLSTPPPHARVGDVDGRLRAPARATPCQSG